MKGSSYAFAAPMPLPSSATQTVATSSLCRLPLTTSMSAGPSEASVSRRDFVKLGALSASGALILPSTLRVRSANAADSASDGPFTLPALPYGYDGLEPAISADIMRAHHDAHFAGYVRNLNSAVSSLPSIRDDAGLVRALGNLDAAVPNDEALRLKLRNNGGGYVNHKLFFAQMSPTPRPMSEGSKLRAAIERRYGSVEQLRTTFIGDSMTLFGSGFTWLVRDNPTNNIGIVTTANQDNPIMGTGGKQSGLTPILACDCWEHAWYLQYKAGKKDYFPKWWDCIDWPVVEKLYEGGSI